MATDKPLPMAHFRDGMRARGFPNGTIYGALSTALEHHVLRKVMVKGVTHYVKEKTR